MTVYCLLFNDKFFENVIPIMICIQQWYEIVIDMVVYYAFLTNQLITMATKCLDQLLMMLALMEFIIL
jgi:hypothetical protein